MKQKGHSPEDLKKKLRKTPASKSGKIVAGDSKMLKKKDAKNATPTKNEKSEKNANSRKSPKSDKSSKISKGAKSKESDPIGLYNSKFILHALFICYCQIVNGIFQVHLFINLFIYLK